jgi:chaperone modulatory protein CbpM
MTSADDHLLTGEIIDEHTLLTVEELCRFCGIDRTYIVALVEEGVLSVARIDTISPSDAAAPADAAQWRFAGTTVRRARTALRLQRDLEINLPGVALALELLEQLERLRRQLNRDLA